MHGWSGAGGSGWRCLLAALVVLVMVGLPAESASAGRSLAAAPDDLGPTGVLTPGGHWTVTLVTGETVGVVSNLEGRVSAAVRQPSGQMRMLRQPNGDVYVIPIVVTPLLVEVLDVELFNVTALIRQGYDDAHSAVVPLIVQHPEGVDAASPLSALGVEETLASIGAGAVDVPKADTRRVADLLRAASVQVGTAGEAPRSVAGITHIWLDRRMRTMAAPEPAQSPPLDHNLTQIGADEAWAEGWTGEGVRVAVLDTGIDAHHPDLVGQVVAEANFSDSPDTVDRVGHGTHVASLVGGAGAAAGGARSGVAPDSDLLVGKVLGDHGFGELSDVIAGMEWAAPQADVVNMSLGADVPSDGSDPLSTALDTLSDQHDVLFVVAAGNTFFQFSGTVGIPGAADRALTVGAVDGADVRAPFSAKGPLPGTFEMKPELVAPGVDIVAARAAGTALGTPVDDLYTRASGTSMATPHAAGAAAVLAQQNPDWTADDLKRALIGSTAPLDADGYDVGSGRLDIGAAIDASLLADHDVVEVALPHPHTEPVSQSLTWTNTKDQPRTVRLDAVLEDRQGRTVEAVSIEPAELTIAAGAKESATVQVDGADLGTGLYSGAVTAEVLGVDEPAVRTPLAVHTALEMVDLSIEATAPAARPQLGPPFVFAAIFNLEDAGLFSTKPTVFFGGRATVQVPVGRYAVVGDVHNGDPSNSVVAQITDPEVIVTEDTTVLLDGAATVPLAPRVEGVETAPPVASSVGTTVFPDAGAGAGFGLFITSNYPLAPVQVSPAEGDPGDVAFHHVFRLQAEHLTARAGEEPITMTTVFGGRGPDLGEQTLVAVDAGDGSDFTGAAGHLAIVQHPEDPFEPAAISERAATAGVAVLAFADEQRPHLVPSLFDPWADIPIVAVAGADATTLRAAVGGNVTIRNVPSPYVYDVVLPEQSAVDPGPVLDGGEQGDLARIDERFHRDSDGTGSSADRRWSPQGAFLVHQSAGPLAERRQAYLTPEIEWVSIVGGIAVEDFGEGPVEVLVELSLGDAERFDAGSRHRRTWLRRPQWPGPVGGVPPDPLSSYGCRPDPFRRSADTMYVSLAPFQDAPDRWGCAEPLDATITLERDGVPLGTADGPVADFPVQAERGTYQLTYEQSGQAPYVHRSRTVWTFSSAAPRRDEEAPVSLLLVDYRLPLDTLNRVTGREATLSVQPVTGTEQRPIDRVRVWTSTDDGSTWQETSVRRDDDGTYRFVLPRVERGVGASLRVNARDTTGSRIEQTLIDAYVG